MGTALDLVIRKETNCINTKKPISESMIPHFGSLVIFFCYGILSCEVKFVLFTLISAWCNSIVTIQVKLMKTFGICLLEDTKNRL